MQAKKENRAAEIPVNIEDIFAAATKFLTPVQLSFFRCQLSNGQKQAQGRRFSTDKVTCTAVAV